MGSVIKASVVTCASVQQAHSIVDALFGKRLISRAEILSPGIENSVKVILENVEKDIFLVRQEVLAVLGKEGLLQEL